MDTASFRSTLVGVTAKSAVACVTGPAGRAGFVLREGRAGWMLAALRRRVQRGVARRYERRRLFPGDASICTTSQYRPASLGPVKDGRDHAKFTNPAAGHG